MAFRSVSYEGYMSKRNRVKQTRNMSQSLYQTNLSLDRSLDIVMRWHYIDGEQNTIQERRVHSNSYIPLPNQTAKRVWTIAPRWIWRGRNPTRGWQSIVVTMASAACSLIIMSDIVGLPSILRITNAFRFSGLRQVTDRKKLCMYERAYV
jgi:hypothetical protein